MTTRTTPSLLALLLGIALLTGCSSTRTIEAGGDGASLSEVNRSVEGKVARVVLRDGTRMNLVGVRVAPDSLTWLDRENNALRALPTHDIAEISIVKAGSGALRGLLVGVLAGAAAGGIRAALEGDDPADDPLSKTRDEKLRLYPPAHAVYAALATTPIGAILGTRRVYRFEP